MRRSYTPVFYSYSNRKDDEDGNGDLLSAVAYPSFLCQIYINLWMHDFVMTRLPCWGDGQLLESKRYQATGPTFNSLVLLLQREIHTIRMQIKGKLSVAKMRRRHTPTFDSFSKRWGEAWYLTSFAAPKIACVRCLSLLSANVNLSLKGGLLWLTLLERCGLTVTGTRRCKCSWSCYSRQCSLEKLTSWTVYRYFNRVLETFRLYCLVLRCCPH
jgi:hypothetical protein